MEKLSVNLCFCYFICRFNIGFARVGTTPVEVVGTDVN